jgi:equilibrative nucleoside transporter 1/2/3
LSVFPALTATVTSIHPGKRDLTVALGFVLWNTGDLLGRILSGTQTLCIRSGRTLLVLSVLRVVFVPLLFLCNIDGQGAHVQSDAFFFVYMLMFGTSNGYVASLCMSGAIDAAADQDKNTVGAVMSLMLCLGLLGGSLLSFLMH